MNDISIGAVGAAIIAGLVSLLGLIIGKEQKVSEFRQAWIDKLRDHIASYLVHINAIADQIKLRSAGQAYDAKAVADSYKLLNEASHGITLRVNDEEDESRALLASMSNFESIATSNVTLTDDNIRRLEAEYIAASKKLLRFEWARVKRGEDTYVWTKRVVLGAVVVLIIIFARLWYDAEDKSKAEGSAAASVIIDNRSLVSSEHAENPVGTTKPPFQGEWRRPPPLIRSVRPLKEKLPHVSPAPLCQPAAGEKGYAAAVTKDGGD